GHQRAIDGRVLCRSCAWPGNPARTQRTALRVAVLQRLWRPESTLQPVICPAESGSLRPVVVGNAKCPAGARVDGTVRPHHAGAANRDLCARLQPDVLCHIPVLLAVPGMVLPAISAAGARAV